MPAPLTYATALPYLLGLGVRFEPIGRSELTYTGDASAQAKYPLLLVEGDAPGSELFDTARPTGVETFTVAVQVLTQDEDTRTATTADLLALTNTWADQLTQQLRDERQQQLVSVNKLPLAGVAGGALATGWRVELTLKVVKDFNRNATRDLFAPEPTASI
jgi:hypothetical protein